MTRTTEVTMRKAILGSVLLATSIACTGCSSGGDGEGSGGSGGSGSAAALSFDAESSRPAAGGAAAAIAFAAQFGNTVASILEALGNAPEAGAFPVTQKINVSDFICPGGGRADLTGQVVEGEEVKLVLNDCAGSPFGAGSASGDITLTIDAGTNFDYLNGGPIYATATVILDISPGGTLEGGFDAFAEASARLTMINLRLGNQEDSDLLTLFEGGQVLQLGCFDILQRIQAPSGFVMPLGVANLGGQIYTINDYATSTTPRIDFDSSGVPRAGDMTLHSGDEAVVEGSDRSSPCGPFVETPAGDKSYVDALFSAGGCISLSGAELDGTPFEASTSWDKLLDRDFTEGGGPLCSGGGTGGTGGSAGPTPAEPPPVTCAEDARWVAYADAYVRGGVENADTPFGNSSNLLIKGDPGLNFARKTYLVFDLSSAPEGFTTATLVLTLDSHVDRQPADLSGIIDNDDWDPADPVEGAITWNNAPRNDLSSGIAFLGQGGGPTAGVRVLAPGYTFDRTDLAGPDPEGTKYAFDVTDFMLWAVGRDESFSASSPGGDNDDMVTLLLALSAEGSADGSSLDSKDVPDEEMCNRPFLHFE